MEEEIKIIEQRMDSIEYLIKNQNDLLFRIAKEMIDVNTNLKKISGDICFKNFR